MRMHWTLGLLAVSCVKPIGETNPYAKSDRAAVERCDDLRKYRDILAALGAGSSVAAGAGGVGALQFTDTDSRQHTAELSLMVGVLGAILMGESAAMGNAYTEEGCSDRFNRIRTIVTGAPNGSATPPPDAAEPDKKSDDSDEAPAEE